MSVSIEHQLNTYIQQLNSAQKKSVLGYIKSLLPYKADEGRITIEQYNKELEEAEAEIERGEFYTHEEAKEIFKKVLRGSK